VEDGRDEGPGAGAPPALPEAHAQEPASPALGEEQREAVELLRHVLEEQGRDAARELLSETMENLGQPEPGAEAAHVAYLLELDRLAEELGSLKELRRLREAVFEIREEHLPPDHPDLLTAKLNLAGTRAALGDLAGARELEEEVLEARTRLLPPDHADLLGAKQNLGATRYALGDLAGAHELFEAVLEARTRLLPPDHHDLLVAKQNLALTRKGLGDLAGARELFEAVLEAWTRLLPPDHPDLLRTKLNLASTRKALGDLQGARELEEAVLEARTRLLPPDHPDLIKAKGNLGSTLYALGDIHAANELFEAVLEAWTRLLPADHPDLLRAKQSLGTTRYALGDIHGANELFEAVLEGRTRLLPPDHPDLLKTKGNLAATRKALGDLAGARELEEEVLEARTRLLPPDHPDLLRAKQGLAATISELGDLAGARELEEAVLAARTRLLPPDHPDLLAARLNLAVTRKALGDLAGAREFEEAVLEARTRLLPPDHPDLLDSKQNLGATRYALGDIHGANELFEDVLEARTRLLSPDHPDLLGAMQNLALTRRALGDGDGARALEEEVLAACTRLLPPEHPDLLRAKQNLAAARYALGDLAGARELFEAVLEARTRLLPPDHPDLLAAKQNLAAAKAELGDLAGARELVSSMLDGLRTRARALRAEAARPAREGARAELGRLFEALLSSPSSDAGPGLEPELFATLEDLRLASVASSESAHALAARPELAELARAVAELRSRLNDLAASGAKDQESVEDWRKSVLELAEERDRAERELRRKLAEAGAFVEEIDARSVAGRLAPAAAVASFLRYPKKFEKDPATGETTPSVESLLAFVVTPDGTVRRVELGAAAELEELVGEWRSALGRPLAGRGIGGVSGVGDGEGEAVETLGTRLRERVLDPVLAGAGEPHALHVVLDDFLHLVPLDALPLGDGLVGERMTIQNEVTLARVLRERRAVAAEGSLTAAGGIDYEAELGEELRLDAATPPADPGTLRSGAAMAGFPSLPETSGEAASIAALFREAFERDASVLSGSAATKAALFAAAPRTRFLHLATHGWFASESFKSQLDSLAEASSRDAFQRAEETLTGFAPETLCGLALAGANRGRDAVGRVPGILTAEELATLDLRNCELAVLSACETNVGIRRAGQGIQSLQTALHAAGVRTAITSLWRVDDAATRRLLELFYTKLWKEHLGKADALWQAKMALRAEGHPPRDWAGWILSGDPD